MARTYASDLTLVTRCDCSEFGLCGVLLDQRPRNLGEAIRAISKRFKEAEASGDWPEVPLWLEQS